MMNNETRAYAWNLNNETADFHYSQNVNFRVQIPIPCKNFLKNYQFLMYPAHHTPGVWGLASQPKKKIRLCLYLGGFFGNEV